MRRQARISAGGALIVRTASALQVYYLISVWLWLLIFIFQNEFRISRSIKPGYLDFDNLPETNFTCEGKVIGGYYADTETSCQMFHVCTVGQNEEPMDIKFLCLNGTVFDQETRVCERVDEVDCTKSEKFYSLNLELYGSTTPPIIQPEQHKPQDHPTEQSQQQTKPNQEKDPSLDDVVTTSRDKSQGHSTDPTDTTEDPIQEIKKEEYKPLTDKSTNPPIQLSGNEDLAEDYQEEEEDIDYEDYSHYQKTTSTQSTTSASTTTTTTTTTRPPTTVIPATSPRHPSSIPHLISSPTPILSSLSPPSFSPSAASVPSALSAHSAPSGFSAPSGPSIPPLSTLDPSLLTPQEFIYRHRGPGSEAISFQRHSFRPADGVYITHAPPQQYDHFQYESSRTAPRPTPQRPHPAPFVQRPQPAQFRPTTLDPREQLLRPVPTSQYSERHETSVKQNKLPSYSQSLPQQSLPFNPFYFDRKRSDESVPEVESSLSARSVAPPNITERPPIKLKSPPRVIVTASASVSDSNGKKLNYTVGNVVSAVKPIVPINYDDYKESDLIFDPFFLDVPKLQIRRKTRSNKKGSLFTITSTATLAADAMAHNSVTLSPVTSRATTTQDATSEGSVRTTTASWNPDDYVDDNYEPHAYMPPPIAVLVLYDPNKSKEKSRSKNDLVDSKTQTNLKINTEIEQSKPTSASVSQISSSQSAAGGSVLIPSVASPPPAPLLEAPACAPPNSSDCRTRA